MKVLVTGANGYLGQGIVKALLEDKIEVVAADFKTNNIDKRATVKACDLFTIPNPYEFFGKPDVLLHLAWRDGFVHNSNAHFEDFYKHYNFINSIVQSDIRKICVMGTMHEIGFYEGSIDSSTSCKPQNYYGIAKNALRDATSLLCKQYDKVFQWLRGYYIVGNSQFGSSIFSKITAAELAGQKEFPFTMGLNQYDFLEYDEFCYQVASIVEQDRINGIINVCAGRPEKLSERVERFILENKFKIKLKYGAFPDRPYDSKAVWGNNMKISEILKRK